MLRFSGVVACLVGVVLVAGCGAFSGGNDVGDAGLESSTGDASPEASSGDASLESGDATPCDGGVCSRVVFVTSTSIPGTPGGSAVGDAACDAAAMAVNAHSTVRGRVFRAWLSDTTTSGGMRTAAPGKLILPSGTVIADSFNELLASGPRVALSEDESGTLAVGQPNVWTGTALDGNALPNNCASAPTAGGFYGDLTKTGEAWTREGIQLCTLPSRLYCFSMP